MPAPILLVHGGAGTWSDTLADPVRHQRVHEGLRAALAAGAAVLSAGAPALAAVVAAVQVLEDDPSFNAGRGAALTDAGYPECDAALIDGASGRAGAVAGMRRLRSPVAAARLVLDEDRHVLLAGPEAEAWLLTHGADEAPPGWLVTEQAVVDLAAWRAGRPAPRGTVGAVARDADGRLAAATSTGGLTGKRPGRIGDSPLIGAGTWADTAAAVSCTGRGESFMRAGFALRTALAIGDGAEPAVIGPRHLHLVHQHGGTGGAIILAADGRWAMPCSDPAMARGMWCDGAARTWLAC
jgi:beta-aspartyl-peptidase (threonine type)